jgi:hypothetical protein
MIWLTKLRMSSQMSTENIKSFSSPFTIESTTHNVTAFYKNHMKCDKTSVSATSFKWILFVIIIVFSSFSLSKCFIQIFKQINDN